MPLSNLGRSADERGWVLVMDWFKDLAWLGWATLFEADATLSEQEMRAGAPRTVPAQDSPRTSASPQGTRWSGNPDDFRSRDTVLSPSSSPRPESAIMREIREKAQMPRLWASSPPPSPSEPLDPAQPDAEASDPMPPAGSEPALDADAAPPVPGQLPADLLCYLTSLGLTPITGVDDPRLKDKLANPTAYGWVSRLETVSTFRETREPTPSDMHCFRLVPHDRQPLGQMVILSEDGSVFLETAGPWGATWMYRSASGEITGRELRTAPVPDRHYFRRSA